MCIDDINLLAIIVNDDYIIHQNAIKNSTNSLQTIQKNKMPTNKKV